MKKSVILFALIIIATLSCNEDYKFYAFYIAEEINIDYPTSNAGDEFSITSDVVDIYSEKIYTQEETSSDLVEEITSENILSSGVYYFNTLKIYIGAEGEPEVLIAEKKDGNLIDTGADIKDIVNASKIYIKTTGEIADNTDAFSVRYNLNLFVKTYIK